MSVENGVSFDGNHSYRDFGLYLSQRPVAPLPEPKLSNVNVPGMDGDLDLTEANTGTVRYNNRQIDFVFAAMVAPEDQHRFCQRISKALHGRRIERIVIDEDNQWYYSGRCTVQFDDITSWKLHCTISVDAEPYAKAITEKSLVIVKNWGTEPIIPTITEETVALPKNNVSSMAWNTDLRFGSQSEPTLDLSMYDRLVINMAPASVNNYAARISIESAGGVYNYAWSYDASLQSVVTVQNLQSHGVDVTKIYRILISNYGDCSASAIGQLVAVQHDFGARSVVPRFRTSYNQTLSNVTFIAGGKSYDIPDGEYFSDEISIPPGEQTVYLRTPSVGDIVDFVLYYTEGKL